MCTRVKCRKCDKPTWMGCGLHVEQVLADVPAAQRCRCREDAAAEKAARRAASGGSWWSRWFGG
jgi:hypothetical protein